jgi:hypothetical protein
VGFTGTSEDHLVNVYTPNQHHSDQFAYFGLIFGKQKELKIFRHSEIGAPELFKTFKLSDAKNLSEIHTVVLPKFTTEKIILFTATKILVMDLGNH